jgi:hypothetical protein
VPVIWEGSITGGGEGGISHPKLCAGAGERSGGPGEDSLQYFSFATGINNTGGKFATGVVDTSGK